MPSPTLPWPGWKQNKISVNMDWQEGLKRSGFKKGCVLLYNSSSEFESILAAFWYGVGAAGTLSTCSFLFPGSDVCGGNIVIVYV